MIGLGSERIHSLCSWLYHETYAFTTGTYIIMKWYKVTGATGWQKMSDRACTAQHCQVVQRVDLHGRAGDI